MFDQESKSQISLNKIDKLLNLIAKSQMRNLSLDTEIILNDKYLKNTFYIFVFEYFFENVLQKWKIIDKKKGTFCIEC
jgi:hypothetical protein